MGTSGTGKNTVSSTTLLVSTATLAAGTYYAPTAGLADDVGKYLHAYSIETAPSSPVTWVVQHTDSNGVWRDAKCTGAQIIGYSSAVTVGAAAILSINDVSGAPNPVPITRPWRLAYTTYATIDGLVVKAIKSSEFA